MLSILLPSLTQVSSKSLASCGSSISSPAGEQTRGDSCYVAFRGVVAESQSTVGFGAVWQLALVTFVGVEQIAAIGGIHITTLVKAGSMFVE
ncbi:hypothetical protein Ahy_A09g044487 [Arachis hypogaea]|uniref:Uncharacterized protein n=1 Tax=Arachis hypogaea TaxID=3818 RepID=A0A445BK53_ARAHY|nr:hypothetical protein Ahy_A09g044487 [Arachis hypogaea]